MYTSVVGRKFVSGYNTRNGTNITAKEYFEEILFPLFFDHPKYLQSSTNTPLFQVIAQKKTSDPAARQKAFMQLASKISSYAHGEEKIPDMSFAVGYGSADPDGTTSGQLTTMNLALEEEDLYASWIGAACGIGIAGGFNILTENNLLLELLEEGWPLYREYVNQNEDIDNKVETWNGVWLAHRLNKDFDKKRPKANFNPISVTKKNEIKMERPEWSKLIFLFSGLLPDQSLYAYIYYLGKSNKTIGFFTISLREVSRLSDMYTLLYGKIDGLSNKDLASIYQTAYGLSLACERFSVIGLRALEPKDLRKYMYANNGKQPAPLKWDKKNEITYHLYITWITAMLNDEELINLAEETAVMLTEYAAGGKKGLMKRFQEVENFLKSGNNRNDAINKLTDMMIEERGLQSTISKVVSAITKDIARDNLMYFLTLIRFNFEKQKTI